MMNNSLPHKFKAMAAQGGRDPRKPPHVIPADALDENFATCLPMEQPGEDRSYDIAISPKSGWRLFPRIPFDVCENGKPVTYLFMARRLAAS
jgi:hypothetical protein